jgi:hypothetical protein
MIFRNSNGHLVEINKYDYPNDQIYYEKVMKLQEEFTKYDYNKIKNSDKKLINKDLFHNNTVNISSSNQVNKICKFINI